MAALREIAALVLIAGGATPADNPQGAVVQGYFREYALDHPASGPAIVAVDDENAVWVALAKTGKLARFSNGVLDSFDIGADSRPVGLAVEHRAGQAAAAIWIAASYDNKIIRFDPLTKEKREFKIDGDEGWPFNVAVGPDGSVWFTERASNRIGRFNPKDAQFKHYDVPTPGAGPAGMAIDPKSGLVWFTESYADGIGVLDPATGGFREIRMSDSSTGLTTGPAGLCLDPIGGVWFAKLEGRLGYIAPGSDSIVQFDVPEIARRPAGITAAPNGDIWAVSLDGNLLLRYSPVARQFRLYPLPTGMADPLPLGPPYAKTSRPFGIALDRQGNVWFSEQYTGKLGVLGVERPALKLFSPAGTVATALPLLSIQTLDRVGGVARLEVRLDGKPVKLVHNHLDLTRAIPGEHRLEVTAYDEGGQSTVVSSQFIYQPGPAAIYDIVYSLDPKTPDAKKTQQQLLADLQEFHKGDPGEKLESLKQALAQLQAGCDSFPEAPVASVMKFLGSHQRRQLEVTLIDKAPFFTPVNITVNKGDSVRWIYDPPSNGHEISHLLHRVVIGDSAAQSPILRAGESFTFRFAEAGTFRVTDSYTHEAMVVVSK